MPLQHLPPRSLSSQLPATGKREQCTLHSTGHCYDPKALLPFPIRQQRRSQASQQNTDLPSSSSSLSLSPSAASAAHPSPLSAAAYLKSNAIGSIRHTVGSLAQCTSERRREEAAVSQVASPHLLSKPEPLYPVLARVHIYTHTHTQRTVVDPPPLRLMPPPEAPELSVFGEGRKRARRPAERASRRPRSSSLRRASAPARASAAHAPSCRRCTSHGAL